MRLASVLALIIFFPTVAFAALININTADVTLLDTLVGIGPTKANAIIAYRTANGPFARIEDILSVSGIGPSTYDGIKDFITVGTPDVPSAEDEASTTPETVVASSTPVISSAASSGGGPTEYIPVPVLRIVTGKSRTVSAGADTAFTAVVYDGKGNRRDDARVTWSFGDGMKRVGASVYHKYYEPGEYVTIVRAATSDGGDASVEIFINAKDAEIKIASVSSRGISLANNGARPLDLSLWRLSMGGKEFKIPEDTQILAGHTILFPSQIIELPISDSASLLYPSGEVASVFPAVAKLSQANIRYEEVQPAVKVEPITSAKLNIQKNEEAVRAPVAPSIAAAAAGAALPDKNASSTKSRYTEFFSSPWTLGSIGVVALAGMAFILL